MVSDCTMPTGMTSEIRKRYDGAEPHTRWAMPMPISSQGARLNTKSEDHDAATVHRPIRRSRHRRQRGDKRPEFVRVRRGFAPEDFISQANASFPAADDARDLHTGDIEARSTRTPAGIESAGLPLAVAKMPQPASRRGRVQLDGAAAHHQTASRTRRRSTRRQHVVSQQRVMPQTEVVFSTPLRTTVSQSMPAVPPPQQRSTWTQNLLIVGRHRARGRHHRSAWRSPLLALSAPSPRPSLRKPASADHRAAAGEPSGRSAADHRGAGGCHCSCLLLSHLLLAAPVVPAAAADRRSSTNLRDGVDPGRCAPTACRCTRRPAQQDDRGGGAQGCGAEERGDAARCREVRAGRRRRKRRQEATAKTAPAAKKEAPAKKESKKGSGGDWVDPFANYAEPSSQLRF